MNPEKVIKNPLSTEKSLRLMESDNKLIFSVDNNASKNDIKEAIEMLFGAKVLGVNTFVSTKGDKRAYVKFSLDTPAIDIATNLGLV